VGLEDHLRFFFSRSDGAPTLNSSSLPPLILTLDPLLFNSGFETNVSFFAYIPRHGDFVVYDQYIHASVHNGMKISRAKSISFKHNSVNDLEIVLLGLKGDLPGLIDGNSWVFIAVESLYSMDGTLLPLTDIIRLAELAFPSNNAYIFVDEAQSTGVYGSRGRGLVNLLDLEDHVFARLHTFGKALAGNGGQLVCSNTHKTNPVLKYEIAVLLVTRKGISTKGNTERGIK
jgi:8-amino-7-oxononanoate synthase